MSVWQRLSQWLLQYMYGGSILGSSGTGFVQQMPEAVHVGILYGAGPALSTTTKNKLKTLNESLFAEARDSLANTGPHGVDAQFIVQLAENLTSLLELSQHTNCGLGSEKTLEGTVECDASMMLSVNGTRAYASVGALPEMHTPSKLCAKILGLQAFTKEAFPRAIPNFIVGHGALRYARMLGLCDEKGNSENSTTTTATTHGNEPIMHNNKPNSHINEPINHAEHTYNDTIGIIIIYDNLVCVSSSSGGTFLKDPGRLGPAAIMGSGFDISNDGIAAVCSGFGEDINTLRLASRVVNDNDDEELETILQGNKHVYMQRPPQFGVLKASKRQQDVLFEWQHSADSMMCAIGRVTAQRFDSKCIYSNHASGGGYKYPL